MTVVSLNGGPPINPHVPVDSVIEELEGLLEAARSGEVQGIAGAVVYGDGSTSYLIVGTIPHTRVAGQLEAAKTKILMDFLGAE